MSIGQGIHSTVKLTVQLSMLQVPFIANYRKEYIDPELNIDDLWKVWAWDEKVSCTGQTKFAFFCVKKPTVACFIQRHYHQSHLSTVLFNKTIT